MINNLRGQAESNRALAEDLIEQQRKQQEASQALTQESVNAYTDFLNSMFSFAQRSTPAAGDPREEAWDESSTRGTLRAGSPDNGARPGGFV